MVACGGADGDPSLGNLDAETVRHSVVRAREVAGDLEVGWRLVSLDGNPDAFGARLLTVDIASPPTLRIKVGASASLAVTLPLSGEGEPVVELVDGELVFIDADAETAYVVSEADFGARLASVFYRPQSSHAVAFAMEIPEGGTLVDGSEGGYAIVREGEVLVSIKDPWAVDAEGTPVKTRYTQTGSVLNQVVEPTESTKYPIVADPNWQLICHQGLNCLTHTRLETELLYVMFMEQKVREGLSDFQALLDAVCVSLGASYAGAVCALLSLQTMIQIEDSVAALTAAHERNQCYRIVGTLGLGHSVDCPLDEMGEERMTCRVAVNDQDSVAVESLWSYFSGRPFWSQDVLSVIYDFSYWTTRSADAPPFRWWVSFYSTKESQGVVRLHTAGPLAEAELVSKVKPDILSPSWQGTPPSSPVRLMGSGIPTRQVSMAGAIESPTVPYLPLGSCDTQPSPPPGASIEAVGTTSAVARRSGRGTLTLPEDRRPGDLLVLGVVRQAVLNIDAGPGVEFDAVYSGVIGPNPEGIPTEGRLSILTRVLTGEETDRITVSTDESMTRLPRFVGIAAVYRGVTTVERVSVSREAVTDLFSPPPATGAGSPVYFVYTDSAQDIWADGAAVTGGLIQENISGAALGLSLVEPTEARAPPPEYDGAGSPDTRAWLGLTLELR